MEKFQKTDPPKCGHSVSKSIFGILKIKKLTPKTTLWNYQKSKLCTRRGEMEKFQKKDPPKRWYSVSKTAFGILEIKKNTPKTTFWKYPKSKQYIRRGGKWFPTADRTVTWQCFYLLGRLGRTLEWNEEENFFLLRDSNSVPLHVDTVGDIFAELQTHPTGSL